MKRPVSRRDAARSQVIDVLTACGLAKSYGRRLRGCNVRNMNPEKAEGLSPERQAALEPLLAAIESVSEPIREYNSVCSSLHPDACRSCPD